MVTSVVTVAELALTILTWKRRFAPLTVAVKEPSILPVAKADSSIIEAVVPL